MEVSALKHTGVAGIHGRSPLLRLQSDEKLIALIRRGNHHAFEALMSRYQSRLLAFCRHMLSSKEDAEDVLQEVFAAAFNAIQADNRALNVRPWLYRIARNRSLNHLRRVQPIGVDSMDVHFAEGGQTTADKVHRREEFRLLLVDVQHLPETQRTALLLREIDALSYDQIAEAMDTTVPSVKSLLVRARVGLAEAAEARQMSCDEVRLELGEVAEGLKRLTPPIRRHLKQCDRCSAFRKQLRDTNKALAAVFPVGGLLMIKKLLVAQFGGSAAGGGAGAAGTAAGTGAAAAGSAAAGGAAGGLVSAGMSAVATKAAAGLAAAAIVGVGAVEVRHAADHAAPVPVVAQQGQAAISDNGGTAAPACHAQGARRRDEAQARAEGQGGAEAGDPRGDDDTRSGRHHSCGRARATGSDDGDGHGHHGPADGARTRSPAFPGARARAGRTAGRFQRQRRHAGPGGEPAARSGPGRRPAADPAAGRASAGSRPSRPSRRPVAQAAVRLRP